jgi:hypothetical protein
MEIVMIGNWAANVANQGIALIASLLEIDERSLLAVGLSRADLIDCLSTPFTTDPTELLVARSRAARSRRSVSRRRMRRGVAHAARVFSRAHQLSDFRSFPCPD